ncbi:MAG TPA: hypothetical protein VF077_05380 [Nitrospiraceae bacterium]
MPRKKKRPVVEPDEPDPDLQHDEKLEPAAVMSGDDDGDEPESVTHTRERLAQLKAESELQAQKQAKDEAKRKEDQAKRDKASKQAEEKDLTEQANLLEPGGSRDQVLERIRQMRDEPPANVPPAPEGYRSEGMRQQLTAEQEAGRVAVAKAQEAAEAARVNREKAAADTRQREGTMEEVRHPNPSQHEQFPANKATLGKTKK